MRAGRAESLDIFRKWLAERAFLRCEGHFSKVAFSLSGRLLAVADDELRILADDKQSELVVRLIPDQVWLRRCSWRRDTKLRI